jgi:hypothetical protein
MFIGHAAAGYLSARVVEAKSGAVRGLYWAAIAGAVAPDLDMLWFHLVDPTRHHHTLFPHFPIVWIGAVAGSAAWLAASRSRWAALAAVFSLNGLVHLVLDSIVGDVWWLAPWVDRPFALFEVHRNVEPWWLNFLLHWTFALELLLWVAAIAVHRRGRVQ